MTTIKKKIPIRIGFVCTGNTCRSPMALALARKWRKEQGISSEELAFYSYGLMAASGQPASLFAQEAIHMVGEDISDHRSQSFYDREVALDYIICMTKAHKQGIIEQMELSGEKKEKPSIITFGDLLDMQLDIQDPFGGDLQTYLDTRDQIWTYLPVILTKIYQGEEK